MGEASTQLGWSVRHYRRRFHAAMGLAPTVWARLVRWERALGELAGGEQHALTDVALAAGYADQAHLTRETRAFAGAPPARLRHAVETAQGHWSLSPARVRFVQDARPS
ncbi:AraC family transcriptional regulator [Ramlibacter terrae]|uniref:AraC family transcriptional regulator n=1 Tax=Ramlibacter terrae TaxID=2732511 RepID=A0ABX6P0H1_9BURK|nr:AraC family transcriptional regulator [Ramlibacter terrae]